MPAQDSLFENPLQKGLIKLTNIGKYGGGNHNGGAIAVYNVCGKAQETRISVKDIHDLGKGEYVIYDWMDRRVIEDGEQIVCADKECRLYLILPAGKEVMPIGLLDKYISFHALEAITVTEDMAVVVLKDGGEFGFLGEKPKKIWINGKEKSRELKEKNGIWSVGTGAAGTTTVLLER